MKALQLNLSYQKFAFFSLPTQINIEPKKLSPVQQAIIIMANFKIIKNKKK